MGEARLVLEGVTQRTIHARSSSLYKHVSGREEILGPPAAAWSGRARRRAAGRARVEDVAWAHREWARENPLVYEMVTSRPLARDWIEPGVEESATEPVVGVFSGENGAARAAWSLVHALVSPELCERFSDDADLDAASRRATEMARSVVS